MSLITLPIGSNRCFCSGTRAYSPLQDPNLTLSQGAIGTIIASFLVRVRGTREPERSVTHSQNLEKFIRELEAFILDEGLSVDPKWDYNVKEFRLEFDKLQTAVHQCVPGPLRGGAPVSDGSLQVGKRSAHGRSTVVANGGSTFRGRRKASRVIDLRTMLVQAWRSCIPCASRLMLGVLLRVLPNCCVEETTIPSEQSPLTLPTLTYPIYTPLLFRFQIRGLLR